ncbi:hypothetical protein Leryth_012119 [Lithospermum erythrorhizon]|nr:hypothetical protein Leryth_012119 [Lithospermum erythrorhizon]
MEGTRSFKILFPALILRLFAALGNASSEGLPPEMLRSASNIIGRMPPEDLQQRLQMASSFQGENHSQKLAARLSRIFLFRFSSKRSFHLNTIQSNKEQLVKIRGKSGKRLKIYAVLDKENS